MQIACERCGRRVRAVRVEEGGGGRAICTLCVGNLRGASWAMRAPGGNAVVRPRERGNVAKARGALRESALFGGLQSGAMLPPDDSAQARRAVAAASRQGLPLGRLIHAASNRALAPGERGAHLDRGRRIAPPDESLDEALLPGRGLGLLLFVVCALALWILLT